MIPTILNGKLRLVCLRQRKEGNEVIVGDLFGECIELGALGLGKDMNLHTPSVWRETLDLLALHVSKASIAKITGVDRATLAHFVRSRHLG